MYNISYAPPIVKATPTKVRQSDFGGGKPTRIIMLVVVIVLGIGILAMASSGLFTKNPAEQVTTVGILTGLLGTYLCLLLLVLISRIPFVERAIGLDKALAYHRKLAPWAVGLIVVHVVMITIGYGAINGVSGLTQFVDFMLSYAWGLPATAAFVLLIVLSVTSIRKIRSKLQYETWWVMHLYFYVAILLSLGHQIISGTFFAEHTILRYAWISLFVVTALSIILGRVVLPLWLSFKHQIRVSGYVEETPGVVSVYFTGKNLNKLKVKGGQFFQWRFFNKNWWWQAHPYSLSATPDGKSLRITVKDLGDQSSNIQKMAIGTRVVIEGPYGTFKASQKHDNVVCFAAGCGIAPIRGMLEDFSPDINLQLLYRVSNTRPECILLHKELEEVFCSRPNWNLQYLPGSRCDYDFNSASLHLRVPELATAGVYICGPDEFGKTIENACLSAGTPRKNLHRELYLF